MKNIYSMLRSSADRFRYKQSLKDDNYDLNWVQLHNSVISLALLIDQLSLPQKAVGSVICGHDVISALSILSVNASGNVFQVLPPSLKDDQLIYQLSKSNCSFAIIDTRVNSFAYQICMDRNIPVITENDIDKIISENSLIENDLTYTSTSIPSDSSNIIFTSGSTGLPKGVLVPQKTLLDGARIVSEYLNITAEDRILSILPFSFDYGLNQLISVIFKGATLIFHKFVFPLELAKKIYDENISGFAAVPSLWSYFRNEKSFPASYYHLFENLRYVTTAGGAHSSELVSFLNKMFSNSDIYIMYGLTESFRSTYLPPQYFTTKIGSIGIPVPEVGILILDDEGNHVEQGQVGELVHRGAFVTYGYINAPEENENKFIKLNDIDGVSTLGERCVKSGDLVSIDEEGFIFYHGRKDQQIKRHGYRISPTEIELAFQNIDSVIQCVAIGFDSLEGGMEICVFYETSGDELSLQKIQSKLRHLLPSYALPTKIIRISEWPRTSSGKIDVPSLKKSI